MPCEHLINYPELYAQCINESTYTGEVAPIHPFEVYDQSQGIPTIQATPLRNNYVNQVSVVNEDTGESFLYSGTNNEATLAGRSQWGQNAPIRLSPVQQDAPSPDDMDRIYQGIGAPSPYGALTGAPKPDLPFEQGRGRFPTIFEQDPYDPDADYSPTNYVAPSPRFMGMLEGDVMSSPSPRPTYDFPIPEDVIPTIDVPTIDPVVTRDLMREKAELNALNRAKVGGPTSYPEHSFIPDWLKSINQPVANFNADVARNLWDWNKEKGVEAYNLLSSPGFWNPIEKYGTETEYLAEGSPLAAGRQIGLNVLETGKELGEDFLTVGDEINKTVSESLGVKPSDVEESIEEDQINTDSEVQDVLTDVSPDNNAQDNLKAVEKHMENIPPEKRPSWWEGFSAGGIDSRAFKLGQLMYGAYIRDPAKRHLYLSKLYNTWNAQAQAKSKKPGKPISPKGWTKESYAKYWNSCQGGTCDTRLLEEVESKGVPAINKSEYFASESFYEKHIGSNEGLFFGDYEVDDEQKRLITSAAARAAHKMSGNYEANLDRVYRAFKIGGQTPPDTFGTETEYNPIPKGDVGIGNYKCGRSDISCIVKALEMIDG